MRFILKVAIFVAVAALLHARVAKAQIFDERIRFFEPEPAAPSEKKSDPTPKEQKRKFEWKSFMDPESDEFFKEGDYTPPAPFLETLRRPTRENILLFEKWQATKNLLLDRYELARRKYLGVSYAPLDPAPYKSQVRSSLNKFRFVFYFDSNCPHCKAMFATVNEMTERGLYVEAVRIDREDSEIEGLLIPWTRATKGEMQQLNVSAVPLLVAFDDRAKKVYRMTGRKSIDEIAQVIGRAGG